jgi:hypothetical protein
MSDAADSDRCRLAKPSHSTNRGGHIDEGPPEGIVCENAHRETSPDTSPDQPKKPMTHALPRAASLS